MLILAIVIAVILALLTLLFAVSETAIRLNDEDERSTDGISFARMVLLGVFGIVVSQSFTPGKFNWYVVALLSLLIVIGLSILVQVVSRSFAKHAFGKRVLRLLAPVVKSINILFTPLSLPTEVTEEFEQELIDSVEELSETIAREIMVPRIDMAVISVDASLQESMSAFFRYGFSRLPVIGKNLDDVRGVLYIKDVARLIHENPDKAASLSSIEVARKAIFIPESKPVDDLLQEMQKTSTHIALIVDEYGGVAGLVTMEDVIEEIVGNISDEYDNDLPDVEVLEDGWVRVSARLGLEELGEHFEIELEDEDVDSVGGLLAKVLGRLPGRSDQIEFSGLEIRVERIEGRRKRVMTALVRMTEELIAAKNAFEADGE
ncbi:MAG: HlyC/CorC family transporter [Rhodoluna sp.]|nr:HlyC/CorC family transporter [Rhodoluna sp.]